MGNDKAFEPIEKVNMTNRFMSLKEVYEYLLKWRTVFPRSFRLDGKPTIGPANPAQWIFFEITNFEPKSFKGLELGKEIDGTSWNGIYYLTASTQSQAVQFFIDQFEKYKGDPNKIFKLSYTQGKEGITSKRRLFLNATEEINAGWFCKQHASQVWR